MTVTMTVPDWVFDELFILSLLWLINLFFSAVRSYFEARRAYYRLKLAEFEAVRLDEEIERRALDK